MAIPEIRMTFDETNLATFIKELLSLNEKVELVHKRFDSKIIFKCVGSIEQVRDDILTWLKLRSIGTEDKVETAEMYKRSDEETEKSESKSESEQSPNAKIKQFLSEKKNKEGK